MKADLLAGAVVSLVLHGTAVWLGELLHRPAPPGPPGTPTPVVPVILPVESDDPEILVEAESVPKPLASPIPTLPDPPRMAPRDAFTTPVQPPLPAIKMGSDLTMIPGDYRPSAGTQVFNSRQVETQPAIVSRFDPVYPSARKRDGIPRTEVVVRFIVDPNGRVVSPAVLRTGGPDFDKAALDAVTRWKFRPGSKNGRAVSTRMEVSLEFILR